MSKNKNNEGVKYKLIDLFAGAGGLSNGFEQTGKFNVIGAVEINKAAAKTYVSNHNNDENLIIKSIDNVSDITKIDFSQFIKEKNIIGDEIVVIGGPPCQGFSNANRQKNYIISGNNQLVKQFVRAINEIKPIAFLLENVKTMDSDVHKFFVTQHIEGTIFTYSSEQHLSLITKNNTEELKCLVKDDFITLVDTKYHILSNLFEQIIKGGKIKPVIENEIFISRLRSIERKINKLDYLKMDSDKEKKDSLKLISYLTDRLIKNENNMSIQINSIITSGINILKKTLTQTVKQDEAKTQLGPLIDLNRFLLHYQELDDEKISLRKPLYVEKSDDKVSVIAYVKSYNVVKYLKRVFSYYGYKIDDKVLDASNFGVPQRRRRFMVLGVKQTFLRNNNLQLPLKNSFFKKQNTTYDAISDLDRIPPQQDLNNYKPIPYKKNELSPLQQYYKFKQIKIYNHINTNSRDLSIERFEEIKNNDGKNFHSLSDNLKTTYANTDRTQNTIYLRLNYDEPSPTVVNVRKSMWNHPKNAVALSIREAARLQSFRDSFIFFGTKDQQYQQVGNAVPPLLARCVAEKLLGILGDKPFFSIEDEFNNYKRGWGITKMTSSKGE